MTDQTPSFRPTVFLDTNALQYLGTYLRYASKLNLLPYSESPQTYEQIQDTLRQHLPRGIAEGVMNGCKTLAFLQRQNSNDGDQEHTASILTSRLSRMEMLSGILEGQAHARLAREGLSYRMRQRLGTLSRLVLQYLEVADYTRLLHEMEDLFTTLEDEEGIRIDLVEEVVREFSLIATFSELLQSSVFLDVLDCWIYGCTLAIQADQIITFDRYFKHVINSVHSPPDDEWQQMKGKILKELDRLFPVKTRVTLSLPTAPRLDRTVPRSWEGNNA